MADRVGVVRLSVTVLLGVLAFTALVGTVPGGPTVDDVAGRPVAVASGQVPAVAPQALAEARAATVEITARIDEIGTASAGSGAVVDVARGLVLTNAHVVSGAGEARIRTSTGQETTATVLARAPCDDLAVLELDTVPAGLRAFAVDSRRTVDAGAPVTALGYPVPADGLRLQDATLTTGQVRPVRDGAQAASVATSGPRLGDLVEHSAQLIPGNSGGPLIDDDGWFVGVNTLSGADALAGSGFAVPVSRVAQVLPELAAGRGVLDVGWSLTPTGELDVGRGRFSRVLDAGPGLWVAGVDAGSPAEGRFTDGDHVTAVAGVRVTDRRQVCDVLRAHRGETVRVDGRSLGGAVTLDARAGQAFSVELPVPA